MRVNQLPGQRRTCLEHLIRHVATHVCRNCQQRKESKKCKTGLLQIVAVRGKSNQKQAKPDESADDWPVIQ